MRYRGTFSLVLLLLVLTAAAAGCGTDESGGFLVTPEDVSELPQWQQIYTDIAFLGKLGLIAGWHGTILRSEDGGQAWSQVSVPTGSDLNSIAIIDPSTAVAVGSGGNILRSVDAGKSWTRIESPVADTLNAVTSTSGGSVVAVGWNGAVLRSADSGQTWGVSNAGTYSAVNLLDVKAAGEGAALATSSAGTVLIAADGTDWVDMANLGSFALNSISILDGDNILIAAEHGVVFKTINGGTDWFFIENPSADDDLLAIEFLDADNAVAAGRNGALFRSGNGGDDWVAVASPSKRPLRAIAGAGPGIVFAVGDGGTVLQSIDGGSSWQKLRGQ